MKANNTPATDSAAQYDVSTAVHKRFAANAAYTIVTADGMLLVDIVGVWSRETNMKYAHDVKRLALPLSGHRWATLVMLDEWRMSTFESIPVVRELSQWCYNHGVSHSALIYKRDALKSFQLLKMMKSEAPGYQTGIFDDIADGCRWLNTVGYSLTIEQCEALKCNRHSSG